MLAVVDPNVLVSALINRHGSPGLVVEKIRTLELTPVVSMEILGEYADVLRRARFGFARQQVDELLADIQGLAQPIRPAPVPLAGLPDADDAIFIAAALAAACPIVTGNARHFPRPGACIKRLFKG